MERDSIDDNAGFLRSFSRFALAGLRLAMTFTGRPRAGAGPACLLAVSAMSVLVLGLADYVSVPAPRQLYPWSFVFDASWVLVLVVALYVPVRLSMPMVSHPLESALTRAASAIWVPLLAANLVLAWDVALPVWSASVLAAWIALILVRSVQLSVRLERLCSAVSVVFFFAVVSGLLALVPTYPRWISASNPAPAVSASPPLDVEGIYYAQFRLLGEALGKLEPGRPGKRDVYFVGVAGDASQDVFMREVRHYQRMFETQLGAAERSVLLINHPSSIESTPLASRSNLAMTLRRIGQLMDPDEDVLFLYLTSHGTEDGRFIVDLDALGLNDLDAPDLARMLDESGIRWQLVTISACFSGLFLEPLADPNRVVMTAARADRSSFGCENGRDFTYFGEALKNGLAAHAPDYALAFEAARAQVTQREKTEGKEPSQPQISFGDAIKRKLESN